MQISVQDILTFTQGALLQGDLSILIQSVSTDTRTLEPGCLFVCLQGPNFDAHAFIAQAIEKGARAILVQKTGWNEIRDKANPPLLSSPIAYIGVDDTLYALGEIARHWRARFSIPVVAITGSNGKTTTKDLTAAILSEKYKTLATEGNLNNLIGVPLTLFKLDERTEAAVIEMGMNDFGEIERLTEITQPTIGLITNIGWAHVEKLGDLEGVARAKGELFESMPAGTVAVINQDDPFISKIPTKSWRFSFGVSSQASLWCDWHELENDRTRFQVQYLGKTFRFECSPAGETSFRNALAATAVGFALGMEAKKIGAALKRFKPRSPMRLEIIPLGKGLKIINDSYNANPSSMEAALQILAQTKKNAPGLAVLGEMREMGDFAREGHRRVGKFAADQAIGYLIAIGPYAREMVDAAVQAGLPPDRAFAAGQQEEALEILLKWAPLAKTLLIKGSRGAKMEAVTAFLKKNF